MTDEKEDKIVIDKVVAAGDGTWEPCTDIKILTGIEAVRKRPGLYVGASREATAIVNEAMRFAMSFAGKFSEIEVDIHLSEEEGDWVVVSFDMKPELLNFEIPESAVEYCTAYGSEEFRKMAYLVSTVSDVMIGDVPTHPYIVLALSSIFKLSYSRVEGEYLEQMTWEKGSAEPSTTWRYDEEGGLSTSLTGYTAVKAGKGTGKVRMRFTPDMELLKNRISIKGVQEEMVSLGAVD